MAKQDTKTTPATAPENVKPAVNPGPEAQTSTPDYTSDLTDDEVRRLYNEAQEKRAAQKAKYAEYAKRPDVIERNRIYAEKQKARREYIAKRAKELGLE